MKNILGLKDVQKRELEHAFELVKRGYIAPGKIAIDGGAHVGGWSDVLSNFYDYVWAFEPFTYSFRLLKQNFVGRNVVCMNKALYSYNTRANVIRPSGGRDTPTARQIEICSDGMIEAITIDSIQLAACDFIKLDLEGCETHALWGAKKTIEEFSPLVLFERSNLGKRFGTTYKNSRKFLQDLNYEYIDTFGQDELWRHK